MGFFTFNLSWMVFNLLLALIPVVVTMMLKDKLRPWVRGFLLVVWFLFLPNTIYLLTDLQHFPGQFFRADSTNQLLLLVMFVALTIIGVVTYMYSLKPFEQLLTRWKFKKNNHQYFYLVLSFVVAFGVVLGKFQRTHSWYVITDPTRVVKDISDTLHSPQLILFAVLFGFLFYGIYFSLRKVFLRSKN